MFRQWPPWMRWGAALGIGYLLVAAYLLFGATGQVDPTDPNADLLFLPYLFISFPGWAIARGLAHLDVMPVRIVRAIIPLISFMAYFAIGAEFGALRQQRRANRPTR